MKALKYWYCWGREYTISTFESVIIDMTLLSGIHLLLLTLQNISFDTHDRFLLKGCNLFVEVILAFLSGITDSDQTYFTSDTLPQKPFSTTSILFIFSLTN